jgi:hypothetical protein
MIATAAATRRSPSSARKRTEPVNVKTWAFDSVGTRKYAVQIKKAGNGNPFLKLTEGVPQDDGSFRKFSITIWSEDFHRLFATLDEARAFMAQNNIRTPDGHKYDPRKSKSRSKSGSRTNA